MAKAIVPNDTGSRVQLYDRVYGEYPWTPVPEATPIPVGTLQGLQDAVANAQSGDIIEIVWPGTYNLTETLVNAVPNVTVRGHADAAPTDIVLRGAGMDNPSYGARPHGFYSQQPGLSIENLTIEQFYFHAVTFGAGATAPTFEKVHMRDCGQQFLKASAFPAAIDDGVVLDCEFYYTGGRPTTDHDGAGFFYGGFIDVHNGANWLVRGGRVAEITPTEDEINAVLSANPSAVIYYWSPAFLFWNRSSGTIIERVQSINCARFANLGLIERGGGEYDHTGGIVRNNLIAIDSGRLGSAQIADADSPINLWDCPGGKALHNTVITNAQLPDAVQGRWSLGLEIDGNLTDNGIRMRDGATYTGTNNQLDAVPAWFDDPASGDLRLNATGYAAVSSAPRLPDCLYDVDGTLRANPTKLGAHVNG